MPRSASTEVTLSTIATQLGLSISTVSRALRGAQGINPQTHSKVIEAAQTLGYDFVRRQSIKVDSHPHHIMVLAQCSWRQSSQEFLEGMSRASVSMNLAILSHHVTNQDCSVILDRKNQPAAMKAGLVDGLILLHRWPLEVAQKLSEKWPVVSIAHDYAGTSIDLIGTDERQGIWEIMKYLHESGYRKIGFFGLCNEMSWARSRFASYVEGLVRLNARYDSANVVEVTLAEASAVDAFEAGEWILPVLARSDAGVDVWICASDVIATSLCQGLAKNGRRVPTDIGVTGYHRRRSHAPDNLVLTSTIVPDEELGAAALRRLLHRLEYPAESRRSILIPTRLAIGASTRQRSS